MLPIKKRKASRALVVIAKKPRSQSTSRQRRSRKPEVKNIDVTVNSPFTEGQPTANIANLIIGCVEGTAPTQHVGRIITLRSLTWRMAVRMASTTTGEASLRMLFVYDRQPNGVLPAATAIVATDEVTGLMNLSNSHRFKVIADIVTPCIGASGPQAVEDHGYRTINMATEFNETNGGTIADITTGSVLILTWCNGLGVASPVGDINTRLRFDDY